MFVHSKEFSSIVCLSLGYITQVMRVASDFFLFGQISELQPELESIETHEQRVKIFLLANGIEADKEVPTFLSMTGASNFMLLSTLLAPDHPASRTVDELLRVLMTHFSHK
uniref:Uncharacterized protein n=1 Tax=Amphimedon queenslandica TaxID=400682 RepID=A0A1X7V545_AMPQE